MEGGAYFEVVPGNDFKVKTASGEIKVLGTRFEVVEFARSIDVTCYEGRVWVNTLTFQDTLNPGDAVRIENGALRQRWKVNANGQPSWKQGYSRYQKTRLARILKDLEDHYDIKVNYPEDQGRRTYTGAFTHNDLNEALNQICVPLNLNHELKGKQVTITTKK